MRSAPLPVALAEGSIAANMGQLRLVDPVVHAKGAELAPTGSIDLTQGAIDARLTLSAPKGADAAGPPDISVSLKGPLDAPRRTLDVGALANWLALRALDQKSKHVDALEQAAREHADDAETTGSPTERDPSDAVPSVPPRAGRPGSVATPIPGPVGLPRQRPTQDPAAAAVIIPEAPPPPPAAGATAHGRAGTIAAADRYPSDAAPAWTARIGRATSRLPWAWRWQRCRARDGTAGREQASRAAGFACLNQKRAAIANQAEAADRATIISSRGAACRPISSLSWLR